MSGGLSQFIIKVHGRCDLACDHCYVYEHADQSWRAKNKIMTLETLRSTAYRIAEHAATHRLPEAKVILHGGEPLLAGPASMRAMLTSLRETIAPVTKLRIGMQTNAVRLSPKFCDLFAEFDVRIGVSLDGHREANDLHRRFANGASSYDSVLKSLELLRRPEYHRLYAGLLCTIDIRNDPIRVYEALLAQQPPRIDFLLPHATWEQPPLRIGDDPTPYATWLGRIYRRWLHDGQPVRVKIFESIAASANGLESGTEQFGVSPVDIAVVETNGEWEQADSLKTAFDGAPATGLNVFANSVDEVAALPEVRRRQSGIDGLSAACRSCEVVEQCGGGLFAHRYRAENGFDNPSVYCSDLKEFVSMIAPSEQAELPEAVLDSIARGDEEQAAIGRLAQLQLSINRDLLSAVAEEIGDHPYARAGWEALVALDSTAPEACDTVLAHPYLRPWAVSLLKPGASADHLGYLCSIAAAVAIRAGASARLTVEVSSQRVHLPTVGTAYLPISMTEPTAVVTVEAGHLAIEAQGVCYSVDTAAPHGVPWWQPSHRWSGDGLTVVVEDGDPYRDCHNWQPVGRLSDAQADAWKAELSRAWQLIQVEAPRYVAGLRAGLRAVVPLQPAASGHKASTARHAFGAVAASYAPAPALAVMLVHEFQHGKLGAVLDQVDLFDPRCDTKLAVGWREDLRPIEGVLQGTFAHLAVADIWRARAAVGSDPEAETHYAQYRDWTSDAIEALRRSRALTRLGERFVDQMASVIDGWCHADAHQ